MAAANGITRPRALITPALSLAALTLFALLPWGMSAQARFVLPMLPLVPICYWGIGHRGWLASPLIFACGLAVDVVTRGPIGFWAMIFLLGNLAAAAVPVFWTLSSLRRWVAFTATCAGLAGVQWAAASAYFLSAADLKPFLFALAILSLSYPVFGALFGWNQPRDDI